MYIYITHAHNDHGNGNRYCYTARMHGRWNTRVPEPDETTPAQESKLPSSHDEAHEEFPLKSALISNKPGKRVDFMDVTACEERYQHQVRTVITAELTVYTRRPLSIHAEASSRYGSSSVQHISDDAPSEQGLPASWQGEPLIQD